MQFQFLAAILPFLALTSAAPLGEEASTPLLSAFTLSTAAICPSTPNTFNPTTDNRITIGYGSACGRCIPVSPNPGNNSSSSVPAAAYTIIQDTYIHSLCRLRLYQTATCDDDGAISGPNCWTPDGGIKAYKVDCPYWPEPLPAGARAPCV